MSWRVKISHGLGIYYFKMVNPAVFIVLIEMLFYRFDIYNYSYKKSNYTSKGIHIVNLYIEICMQFN